VCVALGNRGDVSAIHALAAAVSSDPAPLVRAHAAWALGEIARRDPSARARVDAALAAAASDPEPSVREEALAAHPLS